MSPARTQEAAWLLRPLPATGASSLYAASTSGAAFPLASNPFEKIRLVDALAGRYRREGAHKVLLALGSAEGQT